ncbi:MAG TPA: PqqD family protein [Longimicrobiaceae bacterium]
MPAPITLDTSVRATKEQVSCEVSPDVIILNLKNGEYYGLNEVGAVIWELLQESRSVLEIRDRILERYPDVSIEECTGDLLNLLEELSASDLIEIGVSTER